MEHWPGEAKCTCAGVCLYQLYFLGSITFIWFPWQPKHSSLFWKAFFFSDVVWGELEVICKFLLIFHLVGWCPHSFRSHDYSFGAKNKKLILKKQCITLKRNQEWKYIKLLIYPSQMAVLLRKCTLLTYLLTFKCLCSRVPKSTVYHKYESDVMGSQAFGFYHHWGSTLSQGAIRELTHLCPWTPKLQDRRQQIFVVNISLGPWHRSPWD